MEILAGFILLFLVLRTLVSLINLISGLHLPDKKPETCPKVSILIPARNEELTVGSLLTGLQELDYPDFEVIVCNDHSSDNTEEILNWFAGEDHRFQWFLGEKLQEGWLGKNFACHQLAQKASGKYFVFLDADVELSIDAITKAVYYFQHRQLSLLSVFPQQKMESFAEQITVPVMNWILQSLLPMYLVQKLNAPSISAANGQFMMFDAANYWENHWHEKVKMQTVEDIRIARLIKTEGFRTAVLLGNHDIFCRMYRTLDDAIVGFSRNIHEYFGGRRMVLLGFWLIVLFGPAIVCATLGWVFFVVFAILVVANRVFVAVASRQLVLRSVLLHPLQMISFTAMFGYNIYRRIRKVTEWKGRKINL
jgi:glycosyltransferase involved in cell wall biosynthesis